MNLHDTVIMWVVAQYNIKKKRLERRDERLGNKDKEVIL